MRTTVEIPPDLRKQLVAEAAERNLRGYSRIVVDALRQYFGQGQSRRASIVRSLRGSMKTEELEREQQRLKDLRGNWRI